MWRRHILCLRAVRSRPQRGVAFCMKTVRILFCKCACLGPVLAIMKRIPFHGRANNVSSRKTALGMSVSLLILFCFVVYLTNSLVHLSHESAVVKILNHVAISAPSHCDPDTNFDVNYSQPAPHVDANGKPVPNIVHYIWYTEKPTKFKFHHMLSILSAVKFLQPDVVYFHTNLPPIGEYWDKVRKLPNLRITMRKPTTCLFGAPILNPLFGTSSSNVDRLTVLMTYGGIYLDLDVLIVRSFDPLREYQCTIGKENPDKVCGSIIIAARDSAFLKLWMEHFIFDYKMWTWAYNSGVVPTVLSRQYPHLVHVEEDKLNRPDGDEIEKIWGSETFDWRSNYAVHLLYYRWRTVNYFVITEPDEEYIRRDNSTFSQVARRILYS